MSHSSAGAVPPGRHRRVLAGDTGAAAVELALVLPVVLLLVVGMVRFGVAFNAKIEMSGAAREAARSMVVFPNDQARARTSAQVGASTLGLTDAEISISNNCAPGSNVTVTISRSYPMGIPFGPQADKSVAGVARMQC